MCGRYTLTSNPLTLQQEFGLDVPPVLEPRYNIAPFQAAPILTAAHPRQLTLARWGLVPSWAKDERHANKAINARAETVHQKPTFQAALKHHRCVVPTDGFYEWRTTGKVKQPLAIQPASGRPLGMAGLWSTWRSPEGVDLVTFTILTVPANDFMRPLHERMPAFLAPGDRERWLAGPGDDVPALLSLLKPWEGEPLTATEVSPRVNSVAHDDAGCLAPATSVQLSLL